MRTCQWNEHWQMVMKLQGSGRIRAEYWPSTASHSSPAKAKCFVLKSHLGNKFRWMFDMRTRGWNQQWQIVVKLGSCQSIQWRGRIQAEQSTEASFSRALSWKAEIIYATRFGGTVWMIGPCSFQGHCSRNWVAFYSNGTIDWSVLNRPRFSSWLI
jgi:hypothetical protein